MLLIASCDKPQSENKATSSSSVDTENGGAKPEPKPVVDGDDGEAKPNPEAEVKLKPENRAALMAEIKRAIKEHGNEVDLNYIDTSVITDMSNMFAFTAFNGDISKWDVSQVTTMRGMFYRAIAFNGDISAWNVSKVTNMRSMFSDAKAFNGDISAWDVSQVTTMYSMFEGATAFNQKLGSWGKKLHANIKTNMRNALNMFKNSGVSPVPTWCTESCAK